MKKKIQIQASLTDSSRQLADLVVQAIGTDKELFGQAIELAFADLYPLSMRAANVVQKCWEKHPELIFPYLNQIVRKLPEWKVPGVKRCLSKPLVSHTDRLDDQSLSLLIDFGFRAMASPAETIAVRAYMLHTLFAVSRSIPEICDELAFCIETHFLHSQSRGLRSLGKKTLRQLAKQKKQ